MASLHGIDGWDDEADVVVLGFGLSGAVSAIEAHDADPSAEVLVIERMDEGRAGGNSRASGQQLWVPDPEDVERLLAYQRTLNEPHPIPERLLRIWAEALAALGPWIERMADEVGMRLVITDRDPEFPEVEGASAARHMGTIYPAPSGVWWAFRRQVDRRPIEVRYDTRVVDLVQDPDTREVLGVVVEGPQGRQAIRARRAVVLCVGGFENNLDMQRNLYGLPAAYTLGTPGNTGDGIRLLAAAGADLWHVRSPNQTGGFWPGIKVPDLPSAFFKNFAMSSTSWLEVARDDRRFWNETDQAVRGHHFKKELQGSYVDVDYPFIAPIHMIFDDATRRREPVEGLPPGGPVDGEYVRANEDQLAEVMGWNAAVEGYRWSADNSVEVERGWIVKADSIRELAEKLGRDPDRLEATVREFDEQAGGGRDAAFGRAPETMSPLAEPPFYAVEVVPGLVSTTGGGKRDEHARVLDHDGNPIPRLYEAGELGSIMANLYQTGAFLTECMIFGRIAGRGAVAETVAE